MINSSHNNKPYSAEVLLILHAHGREYRLAQVTAERIILRETVVLPPCDAEVAVSIDGNVTRHAVHLPHGATHDSLIVRTQR